MRVKTAHDLITRCPYLSGKEIDALQELVRHLPKEPNVINIGAGAGVSGLAIFQVRNDVHLWTVDIDDGCLSYERWAIRKAGYGVHHSRHHQVLGDSREVASSWKHCMADMIFVDDGHMYDEVIRDILGWKPHLCIGGIMVFHDYGAPEWSGVKMAVDELMSSCPIVMHIDTLIAFMVHNEKSKSY